jgi:hypothetical protein
MSQLDLLPERLRDTSISPREIVLPLSEALEAIDLLESRGVRILGWEGWVKTADGRVGHGSAPQGWSTDKLTDTEAAQLCRTTIPNAAAEWAQQNPCTTDLVHFCITVRT